MDKATQNGGWAQDVTVITELSVIPEKITASNALLLAPVIRNYFVITIGTVNVAQNTLGSRITVKSEHAAKDIFIL